MKRQEIQNIVVKKSVKNVWPIPFSVEDLVEYKEWCQILVFYRTGHCHNG